jgi:hypothetical protein
MPYHWRGFWRGVWLGPLAMLMLLAWPHLAAATSSDFQTTPLAQLPHLDQDRRNVVILLGYIDELEGQAPGPSHHLNLIMAQGIGEQVATILSAAGYKQNQFDEWRVYSRPDTKTVYHFYDVNELCPNDRFDPGTGLFRRSSLSLCAKQREKIEYVLRLLEQDVRSFDEFIYIGHSRKGHGIAAGPFTDATTYPLHSREGRASAAAWVGGRLTSIKLFSCSSDEYYEAMIRSLGLSFKGFDAKLAWSINPDENTLARALELYLLH